ncbi:STK_08120 family protein [Sulfuracidifex metallicus]|uniref:DUF3211 domain-containing protein n=1 Tax=Sulfuracidifex metallicus DSM 6482 = JCM 9184 TaxID=523847 RepID=A0A6A9QN34_SULME|nr:STK_08120 family protein [Sulfuracidifex metallicus]MUN29138.1 DUF3211 domain-containing protein [Sulfuracidifex metallicus DSM 6482 = JCM 9184]WOE50340.1 DUF3211 family protein [Sulfuracidifex metallicus DSM 6482 = JCM 9184]
MDVQYTLDVEYSKDVLLAVLSDPDFVIRTFLPEKETKKEEENLYSVTMPGTLGKMRAIVRYVNNSESITLIMNFQKPKGVGKMIIKPEDRKIMITGSASIVTDPVLSFSMNRKMSKLKKEINEIIRLERIRRKI